MVATHLLLFADRLATALHLLQVRMEAVTYLLLLWLLVVWIGARVSRTIGKSSPRRQRHGKYVLAWMHFGLLVGGSWAVVLTENTTAMIGLAMFSLLVGWFLGTLHGAIVLLFSQGTDPLKQMADRLVTNHPEYAATFRDSPVSIPGNDPPHPRKSL